MSSPHRAVFRLPAIATLVPIVALFVIVPLATVGGAWSVLFIVPVIAVAWLVVTRTTATADEIATYGLLGVRRMAWPDVDRLELPDARWAIVIGMDNRHMRLPTVRPRDVPRLVAVSGGSLNLDIGSLDPKRQDGSMDHESGQDAQTRQRSAVDDPATDVHGGPT